MSIYTPRRIAVGILLSLTVLLGAHVLGVVLGDAGEQIDAVEQP